MAIASQRAGAWAPAGVGLALLVVTVQVRMNDSWADGVLLLVAAAAAGLLLYGGLTATREDPVDRAAATLLLVAGLALAGVAIARLGQVLGGDGFGDSGGTLTWMLALFTALTVYCHARSRSVVCVLIGSLAAVGLLLAAVHWIFQTDDFDVYRALLAFSFLVLFGAGVGAEGRTGTLLVAAAGVTVLAEVYATGLFFLLSFEGGDGVAWGWELVTLLEGAALALYAVQQREPGPGYLAFFVLGLFALSAAADSDATLVGWPLALAVLTALAGVRAAARA
jgi:hypothetical protein